MGTTCTMNAARQIVPTQPEPKPNQSLTKARSGPNQTLTLSPESPDPNWKENVIATQSSRESRRYWSRMPQAAASLTGALNDYPCGGTGAMLKWLTTKEVKAALHIDPEVYFSFFSMPNANPDGPNATFPHVQLNLINLKATFFLSDNGVGSHDSRRARAHRALNRTLIGRIQLLPH